ncbi:hypothetical protein QFC20_006528 [Naganishia adeliensis]|uniref:Uncharacterized protein n=1 Tax=Naganishia adeliensis TaxID=92952 RepID=A0ACC2VBH6_9TREE|nr:hypothetical protein QFC20_006528 [Naganishia adeliensis]
MYALNLSLYLAILTHMIRFIQATAEQLEIQKQGIVEAAMIRLLPLVAQHILYSYGPDFEAVGVRLEQLRGLDLPVAPDKLHERQYPIDPLNIPGDHLEQTHRLMHSSFDDLVDHDMEEASSQFDFAIAGHVLQDDTLDRWLAETPDILGSAS